MNQDNKGQPQQGGQSNKPGQQASRVSNPARSGAADAAAE